MDEAGKRYRQLNIGERIEKGDQVRNAFIGWNEIHWTAIGAVITNPKDNAAYPCGFYRREIPRV